jgi:hypothetical protein
MQFLKKHYEKIVLGVVLAGLVGALVFMPFYIHSENQATTDLISGIIKKKPAELPPLDLSSQTDVMGRLTGPYNLDLETTNHVFNPQEWQKANDGTLIPAMNHTGAAVVQVTNIAPLYIIITLDSVITNDTGWRFAVGVEKQTEKVAAKRRKQQHYVSKGDKPNETFSLVDYTGSPDNPDAAEVKLKLTDTGDIITVSHDKKFQRVDGYTADFLYPPENRSFHGRRVGDKVSFSGTDYIVDSIGANELVLQDQSNQKKTARSFSP